MADYAGMKRAYGREPAESYAEDLSQRYKVLKDQRSLWEFDSSGKTPCVIWLPGMTTY